MSDESIELIQRSWLRSKGVGAVLGAVFYRNLLSINDRLRPVITSGMQSQHDLLLNQLLDDVVEALNENTRLVAALTKLRALFWLCTSGDLPFEDIGSAILMTLEQVMADDFTCQVGQARSAVEDRFKALKKHLSGITGIPGSTLESSVNT